MRAAGRTIIATLELEQDAARHVAQLTDELDELQRGEVVDDGLLRHDQEAMTVEPRALMPAAEENTAGLAGAREAPG